MCRLGCVQSQKIMSSWTAKGTALLVGQIAYNKFIIPPKVPNITHKHTHDPNP